MEKRRRGRPTQYNTEQALGQALHVFHTKGFSATSLDDLADSMGMNRPSLYNAFGNKSELYRRVLDFFIADLQETVGEILFAEQSLARALEKFYAAALDVYCVEKPALGCFVFCTAPAEAVNQPELATLMHAVVAEIDAVLLRRFEQDDEAEFTLGLTHQGRAKIAQAVLHSLALRARSGGTRRELNKIARDTVILLTS